MNGATQVGPEEGYDRWAHVYDRGFNPLLAREERYIIPLLPARSKRAVLDLACGTGRWLKTLIVRGAENGVGVDFSSAMLHVARFKVSGGDLTSADCLNLPFAPSTFDFAICSFALSHIQDLRRLASELARVMRCDSDVFLSDLHSDAYALGWRTSFRDNRGLVEIRAIPHTSETITRNFRDEGFELVAQETLLFGEAEESIFKNAGKDSGFEDVCRIPAILFSHFRLPMRRP